MGESVQLTDFSAEDEVGGFNKSADGELITYMKRGDLYAYFPETGEERLIDKDCNILRELELPYYCNHYHANIDNTKLVADAVNDLVLIDISTDEPSVEVLAEHNTSWRYQASHPHPTYSWSNNAILYRSDCDEEGAPQLYLIKM